MTAYYSAVINLSAAQATGDYFLHLIDGLQTSGAFRGRLFAKSSGVGYVLGIRYGSTDTVVYDTTVLPFNTSEFVVVKLTSIAGLTNDTASLFINPTLGQPSEPAATVTTTQIDANQDWGNIDFIAIRQGTAANAPTGTVDT